MPSHKKAQPNPTAKKHEAPLADALQGDSPNRDAGTRDSTGEQSNDRDQIAAKTVVDVQNQPQPETKDSLAHGVTNTPRSTKSWYGSWPLTPKAAPVAQVVNDNISSNDTLASTPPANNGTRKASPKTTPKGAHRTPSSYLSPGAASRALPIASVTTRLNISSDGLEETKADTRERSASKNKDPPPQKNSISANFGVPQKESQKAKDGSVNLTEEAEEPSSTKQDDDGPRSSAKSAKSVTMSTKDSMSNSKDNDSLEQNQSTWMAWFSRSDPKGKAIEDSGKPESRPVSKSGEADKVSTKQQDTSHVESIAVKPENKDAQSNGAKQLKQDEAQQQRRSSDPNPQPVLESAAPSEPTNRSSWLGMWGSNRTKTERAVSLSDSKDLGKDSCNKSTESLPETSTKTPDKPDNNNITAESQNKVPSDTADTGGTTSSWVFWSRPSNNASKENIPGHADAFQPAVSSPLAQSQSIKTVKEPDSVGKSTAISTNTSLGKRARPASVEFQTDDDKKAKSSSKASITDSSGNTAVGASATDKPSNITQTAKVDNTNNLLLPLFKHTYPIVPERWSLLQQIGRLFYGRQPPAKHPSLIKEPVHIKHALAIGVHGYFPGALISTFIGRPTGTSVKFAESAASAIHRFTETHGYKPNKVDKIALEGEGRIEERLEILWKLLLNWIDTIRKADFILVACHSQGVPVAVSLVAKLIGFGCVNAARIGVCAMAGVNLGPFVDYKSKFLGGSAGELFDFAQPESRVSQGYETALNTLVRFGAKVTFIGSLDDQLVSLHSSTFGTAQHPNIYRAVWIDGRLHIPDFLTHLVGFALKLRNLGVSDHGLIRELSNPLAGNLVGGEGHSRIYEDPAVYNLAIEFALGTTCLNADRLTLEKLNPLGFTAQNPYILPFAMRGLLEEDFVRKELSSETIDLLKQFDDWKPTTKVLRDVKYRLEGIKSKL